MLVRKMIVWDWMVSDFPCDLHPSPNLQNPANCGVYITFGAGEFSHNGRSSSFVHEGEFLGVSDRLLQNSVCD